MNCEVQILFLMSVLRELLGQHHNSYYIELMARDLKQSTPASKPPLLLELSLKG